MQRLSRQKKKKKKKKKEKEKKKKKNRRITAWLQSLLLRSVYPYIKLSKMLTLSMAISKTPVILHFIRITLIFPKDETGVHEGLVNGKIYLCSRNVLCMGVDSISKEGSTCYSQSHKRSPKIGILFRLFIVF